MTTRFLVLLSCALLFATFSLPRLVGQDPAAGTPSVFPPGKPELGKSLFLEKGCHQCHSAGATKLPAVELAPRLVIDLGGTIHANWTRDDFARAIMNPNHLVAEEYRVAMMRLGDNFKAENSPMPEFSDILRVTELIHLAAFLDELSE